MLFFPTKEDISAYTQILSRLPVGMPESNPQRKLQQTFAGMFYMLHIQDWSLVSHFILAGGLRSLVSLFTKTQTQLQSQAVDAFLQITAHPSFDWFTAPGDERTKSLHSAMLGLVAAPPGCPSDQATEMTLLGACMRNANNPALGTSYFCLQLIAFWLSWARKLHTRDGQLTVTQELVDCLQMWGSKMDQELGAAAAGSSAAAAPDRPVVALGAASSDPAELRQQEADLAKRLHADFQRHLSVVAPADSVGVLHEGLNAEPVEWGSQDTRGGQPEAELQAAIAQRQPALDALTACEAAKVAGNEAYQGGKAGLALGLYRSALAAAADAIRIAGPLSTGGDEEASTLLAAALDSQCTLCSNTCAVLLRVAQYLTAEETAATAPPAQLQPFEVQDPTEKEIADKAKTRVEAVGGASLAPKSAAHAVAACVASATAALTVQLARGALLDGNTDWTTAFIRRAHSQVHATAQAPGLPVHLTLPFPWEAPVSALGGVAVPAAGVSAAQWTAAASNGARAFPVMKALLRSAQALNMANESQLALHTAGVAIGLHEGCAAPASGEAQPWDFLLPTLRDLHSELQLEVRLMQEGFGHGEGGGDMASEVLGLLMMQEQSAAGAVDIGAGLDAAEAEFELGRSAGIASAGEPAVEAAPAGVEGGSTGLGDTLPQPQAPPSVPKESNPRKSSNKQRSAAVASAGGFGALQAATQSASKPKKGAVKKSKAKSKADVSSVLAGYG